MVGLPCVGYSVPVFFSHDAEPDDMHSVYLASIALKDRSDVTINCTIGNEHIRHVPNDGSENWKEKELSTRIEFTQQIFQSAHVIPGAMEKKGVSEDYIAKILRESNRECLVLHTDSFYSLNELFQRANKKQLSKVLILAYGSINTGWAIPKTHEGYNKFYSNLKASGAKLVQIDGFPVLELRNKITHKNTPITYALLQHLDTAEGIRWREFADSTAAAVREGQAQKVARYIETAKKYANQEELAVLEASLSEIAATFGNKVSHQELVKMLHQDLVGEIHDQLSAQIIKLRDFLFPLVIQDPNYAELEKPAFNVAFNIYSATTLAGQILIADQIPTILLSEIAQNNNNGLGAYCRQVQFTGISGGFAQYAVSSVQTGLYYLKAQWEDSNDPTEKERQIDAYLKYIDLFMSTSFLAGDKMISAQTRHKLLSDDAFKQRLHSLISEVQGLGFSLPQVCYEVLGLLQEVS